MDDAGKITISDLSKAYYIYFKTKSIEERNKAIDIIGNAPKEIKTRLDTIKQRKKRLRRRLNVLFDKEDVLYFLTLTFSDEYINDYVKEINKFKRKLKKDNIKYIINEDFGGQFGRVHFHCIINKRIKVLNYWICGGFKNIKIKKNNVSLYKISDYLNKLVNHGLKESNKRIKVYYNL